MPVLNINFTEASILFLAHIFKVLKKFITPKDFSPELVCAPLKYNTKVAEQNCYRKSVDGFFGRTKHILQIILNSIKFIRK